jgi:hypothetical protein
VFESGRHGEEIFMVTERELADATPVRLRVEATAEAVADVLCNGWSYASWVVGASRIRGVDPAWPAQGSSIAHSVGLWPALISDRTHSVRDELPHRLELKARAWPTGEAHVVITVEPLKAPDECLVSITEEATSGPASLLPGALAQPAVRYRNTETLRRLALLAERRPPDEART